MAKSTAVKKALAVASAASDARHDLRWASQMLDAARVLAGDHRGAYPIAIETLVLDAEKQVNSAKALLDKANA